MLLIPQSVYSRFRQEAEAVYPQEGCGVLVGTVHGENKTAVEAIAMTNISTAPRNHYEIDPRALVGILRSAQALGLEILGFYHSHPDHEAYWSRTDLAEAHWLGCSYVITSIEHGVAAATAAFHLAGANEDEKHFVPETIQFSGDDR